MSKKVTWRDVPKEIKELMLDCGQIETIKSVTNSLSCAAECSIVVNGETHSYKPTPTLPALPYGAELICREMEVSDDGEEWDIEFVIYKESEKTNNFYKFYTLTEYDGDCCRYAREIDPENLQKLTKTREKEKQKEAEQKQND